MTSPRRSATVAIAILVASCGGRPSPPPSTSACTTCRERAPLAEHLGCYWLGTPHDIDTPAYCVEPQSIALTTGADRMRVRWVEQRPGELHAEPRLGANREFILFDRGPHGPYVAFDTDEGRKELERVAPDAEALKLLTGIPPTRPLCDHAERCRRYFDAALGGRAKLTTPAIESVRFCRRTLDEATDALTTSRLPVADCARPHDERR